LEIVNPNHTNNAGTFSDQPVQSGGGVNMFSAQILGRTDFYTGINPLRIGRTAGGVIDMHLHETVKPEMRVKAGLLGFELGGGKAIGTNGILDLNLRYSFTGLLADLGVDFGGEKIGFYDGVIAYTHQAKTNKIKAFFWTGSSKNIFEHVPIEEVKERYKDFFDIDYRNNILGGGIRYDQIISEKLSLVSGAAYSVLNTEYDKVGYFSPLSEELHLDESTKIATAMAEFNIQHAYNFNTQAGASFTSKIIEGNEQVFVPFLDESFLRPYINIQLGSSLSAWLLEAGGEVNYSFDGFGDPASVYPGFRINLEKRISNTLTARVAARHAAGQNIQTFGLIETYNQPLFIKKYEFSISYYDRNNSLSFTPYLQEINNIPVFFSPYGYIHLADQSDPIVRSGLLTGNTHGEARFYGVEGDWKYRSDNGIKVTANQTFYKSIRNEPENEFENSKFDGTYATHVTLAKEIYKVRKEKNRIWNFSLRGILNGGLWQQQIDEAASEMAEQTVFLNPANYIERLPAYKRVDASISRTIANAGSKWRIALDIQNLLNFSNAAFRYYDPYLDQVQTQEQLGIIPVLSVQLSW
jgi:hypothetical protein